MLGMILRKL